MSQDLFRAPSVFNFYSPNNVLVGEELFGPEFAIYSTSTAIARVNFVKDVVYKTMSTNTDRPKGTWLDLTPLQPLAGVPQSLVDELDRRMTRGEMSTGLRTVVSNAISAMPSSNLPARVQKAVYLIASSPEYSVQR